MTPSVVRTVEEARALVERVVDQMTFATTVNQRGPVVSFGMVDVNRWIERLTNAATVLAPLSVTPEQVEAGRVALADAMNYRGAVEDFEWDGFVEKSAEFITAALTAMGIPVVEHV